MDVSACAAVILALLFLLMLGRMYPIHQRLAPVDLSVTARAVAARRSSRRRAGSLGRPRRLGLLSRFANRPYKDLPNVLREGLRNGAEKTNYIKPDARAKYTKAVVDQIPLCWNRECRFFWPNNSSISQASTVNPPPITHCNAHICPPALLARPRTLFSISLRLSLCTLCFLEKALSRDGCREREVARCLHPSINSHMM
jgi:hypothetical protein